MIDEIDYFKKVPHSEKKNIFQDVSNAKIVLMIKPDELDEIIYCTVIKVMDNSLLCGYIGDSPKLKNEQMCFVSFTYKEDKYYFQAMIGPQGQKGEGCSISTATDLFYLQRRKSSRIRLPLEYASRFSIIRKVDKPILCEGKILDFSSGGVKVMLKDPDPGLVAEEEIRGVMVLGIRRPIEIDCIVRHVNVLGNGRTVFGVQFTKMNKITENRMLVLNMDLHREIFAKYSSKKTV